MGSTLWTLISTKLIMMMLVKINGIQLLSGTSLSQISLVYFVFVDNIDLPVTGEQHSIGEDIALSFQEAIDRWIGGLIATCGILAPPKLWCYLIYIVWTGTK